MNVIITSTPPILVTITCDVPGIIEHVSATQINVEIGLFYDGKTAYQLAVENGFIGSIIDWIESLQVNLGEKLGDYVFAREQRLQSKVEELECVIDAWHKIFGTTQLTHAQCRLEVAESSVIKLKSKEEGAEKVLNTTYEYVGSCEEGYKVLETAIKQALSLLRGE